MTTAQPPVRPSVQLPTASGIDFGLAGDRPAATGSGMEAMVAAAERLLKGLNFPDCRVHHHLLGGERAQLCRISVPTHDLPRLVALRERLVQRLSAIGYAAVCVDLAGWPPTPDAIARGRLIPEP